MDPFELYAIDGLLTDEERAIRDTVRDFGAKELRPHVATWFDEGRVPARDLAKQLGALGILGMHLEGYGCAGTGAVAYGLACQEMEAVDSGLRSLVSVQGSLAMYAIHAYGSEEQRQEWLPGMAAGEKLGCFGLTEPDAGSNPASMRTVAKRDASGDWVLNGTKLWITNGSVADVAVVWARDRRPDPRFRGPDRLEGLLRPTRSTRSSRCGRASRASWSSTTSGSPRTPMLPGRRRARRAARLPQRGAVRDHLRLAGRRPRQPGDRSGLREDPRGVRQAPRRIPAHPAEARRHGRRARQRHAARACTSAGSRRPGRVTPEQVSVGKLNNVRKSLAIAREARTILGANGISLEYSPIRHAANLESVLTYEGTTEVHTLVIGKALTGENAFN